MKRNLKNKLMLVLILLFGVIILPHNINAETTYKSLTFKEALAEEQIQEKFTNYKETDDQITIYLFRGKGCGFCRSYLEFMNSITDEYGKYFKIVTYEVWNNQDNSKLLDEVSDYLNQKATGVPYIVIGKKVFAGYANVYDEDIKKTIVDLYNTKKKDRYDVFTEMKKNPKGNTDNTSSNITNSSTWIIIIFNLIFTTIASLVIMSHFNNKYNELLKKLDNQKNNQKNNQKQEKAKK